MDQTQPTRSVEAGFSADFQALTAPFQHELLVHCYRMVGTLEDAEDALQETLLRAWRKLDTLQAPGALRAWLYKIATHVTLDGIAYRKARGLIAPATPPADPHALLPAPLLEPVWLQPLPEELQDFSPTPEAQYDAHESISLAFLTLLQNLPGRQRAVLILCDALGWSAQEVAGLLDLSPAAVNSALQRARATLKRVRPQLGLDQNRLRSDEPGSDLLERYARAWETADTAGLAALLREDVILSMPPLPAWFQGRESVLAFLASHLFAGGGRFRLLPTRANGAPAFAVYQRDEQGIYRPAVLQVLDIAGGQIARMDDFIVFDERLFSRFGLSSTLT
jgi:RNA polymerase sigma-70 factor, ECF subfamily